MNLENLKNPLPAEAVTKHPTKTYLSSIKAIYVTERFNEVFGIGKWRVKVRHETTGDKGMIVVHVTFEVPEIGIYYESFGGNDNGGETSKNFDLGDAYKGATTDALTKIGSYLGVGIDVFKGKHNASTPQQEDTRQWLADKGFEYLLKQGTKDEINTAFSERKMKKEYRTQLEEKLKTI